MPKVAFPKAIWVSASDPLSDIFSTDAAFISIDFFGSPHSGTCISDVVPLYRLQVLVSPN